MVTSSREMRQPPFGLCGNARPVNELEWLEFRWEELRRCWLNRVWMWTLWFSS